MSAHVMRSAIAASKAVTTPVDTSPYYPVIIDSPSTAIQKAAQDLIAASPLPGWFPDVKWEIVEVHRYPDIGRLVGHSGKYMVGTDAIAFVIVRDSKDTTHWLHFRVVESPTPFVEIVHSREHQDTLHEAIGIGRASPGRRLNWITHCTPRTLEDLGGWLDSLDQVSTGFQRGKDNREAKKQAYLAVHQPKPHATDHIPSDKPVKQFTKKEREMTQAEARKAWASMPATTRQNLVAQRLSTTQQNLYNLHLAELAGEQINTEEQDKLTNAAKALQDELDAVEAEVKKEAEEMNKK